MKQYLLCTCALLVLAACANAPSSSTQPAEAKEYRTGSNIPQRSHGSATTAASPDDIEQMRRQSSANTGMRPTP